MKVKIDPSKNFMGGVFGAEDLVRVFPELHTNGVEVQMDDDGNYNILRDGKIVGDCCFFSFKELDEYLLIVECPLPDDLGIRRGSKVRDHHGREGIVVVISTGGTEYEDLDDENHGMVQVWLSDEYNYGSDNCEHYVLKGWEEFLTVLEY